MGSALRLQWSKIQIGLALSCEKKMREFYSRLLKGNLPQRSFSFHVLLASSLLGFLQAL